MVSKWTAALPFDYGEAFECQEERSVCGCFKGDVRMEIAFGNDGRRGRLIIRASD